MLITITKTIISYMMMLLHILINSANATRNVAQEDVEYMPLGYDSNFPTKHYLDDFESKNPDWQKISREQEASYTRVANDPNFRKDQKQHGWYEGIEDIHIGNAIPQDGETCAGYAAKMMLWCLGIDLQARQAYYDASGRNDDNYKTKGVISTAMVKTLNNGLLKDFKYSGLQLRVYDNRIITKESLDLISSMPMVLRISHVLNGHEVYSTPIFDKRTGEIKFLIQDSGCSKFGASYVVDKKWISKHVAGARYFPPKV